MSNMQVDASFLQAVGQKRGRSPSPAPFEERPAKRVSLDPDSAGSTPPPLFSQQPVLHLNAHSRGLFERGVSDDWVTKTGGLKLDSPLTAISQDFSAPLLSAKLWNKADSMNDMNDNHELMMTDSPKWDSQHYTDNNPAFTAFSSPHHLSPSFPMDMSPRTHEPTTPTNRRRRQSTGDHSPMSTTPSHSGVWSQSTANQSPRKSRITMGPRADCEKCRLGVKGHWMHVD